MLEELTTLPDQLPPEFDRVKLAPSERRILGFLMKNEGKVVSYSNLLSAVAWDRRGRKDEPDVSVVFARTSDMRKKLRKAGVPGGIENVYGIGYVWRSEARD